MRPDRRVWAGGAVLIGFVAVMYVVTRMFAPDTYARAALCDISMLVVQAVAFALTCLALRKNAEGPYRWTWVFLALWLACNFFADLTWAWYELVLRSSPPSPSLADLGYLMSYPLGFLIVVLATWRSSDKLRATESALNAMMVTLGIAGVCWPLVLAPLLRSSSGGSARLVTLAYPIGDLLVIAAFASLLLGALRSRPPRFLTIVWAAFLVQVVADSAYFVQTTAGSRIRIGELPRLTVGACVRDSRCGGPQRYPVRSRRRSPRRWPRATAPARATLPSPIPGCSLPISPCRSRGR